MFRVRLFGATRVEVDGVTVPAARLGGAKSRRVLQVLALEGGGAVDKDRLADVVWEGRPPARAVATLESYVCVLRRTLGLGGGRHSALATTAHGYFLDPEQFSVDLVEFRRLTDATTGEPEPTAVSSALGLLAGDLLADEPFADWAVRARECFRRDLLAACLSASRTASVSHHPEGAIRFASRALAADPLSEEATQQLMRALWHAGRRCEALRAFLDLRRVMQADLGEDPGLVTRELYLAILGDSSGDDRQPPGSSESEVSVLALLLTQALDALPGGPAAAARVLHANGFGAALAAVG